MVFRPEFDSIHGGFIHPRLLFPNNPQVDFATAFGGGGVIVIEDVG